MLAIEDLRLHYSSLSCFKRSTPKEDSPGIISVFNNLRRLLGCSSLYFMKKSCSQIAKIVSNTSKIFKKS